VLFVPELNPPKAYGIAIAKAIEPNGPNFLFILAIPLIVALPTFIIPLATPLKALLTGLVTAFVTFLNTRSYTSHSYLSLFKFS
jgi:hypothetical protein